MCTFTLQIFQCFLQSKFEVDIGSLLKYTPNSGKRSFFGTRFNLGFSLWQSSQDKGVEV